MLDRDLRVCFLGDSYVAGVGDSSALGWTGRLTAAAIDGGLPMTAYDLGVRGDTSVLIAARAAAEVGRRVAPSTDSRVVLSFGVNDTVVRDGRVRVEPPDGLEAFERIRLEVGLPLLLVGPPAVHDPAQDARSQRLNEALRLRTRDLGVPFVDVFAATAASDLWRQEIEAGDHFHPDRAGYELLASIIVPPALAWFGAPAARAR